MRILAVSYPKTKKDEDKLEFFNRTYYQQLKHDVDSENKKLSLKEPDLSSLLVTNAGVCKEFVYLY